MIHIALFHLILSPRFLGLYRVFIDKNEIKAILNGTMLYLVLLLLNKKSYKTIIKKTVGWMLHQINMSSKF